MNQNDERRFGGAGAQGCRGRWCCATWLENCAHGHHRVRTADAMRRCIVRLAFLGVRAAVRNAAPSKAR